MYHYQLPWFKKKQLFFAKELSTENFQASDGWLQRWKEGDNILLKTVSEESKSVTSEMLNAWSETSLQTLLSNYHLKEIYNADEFGHFYQCFPNKTYQLKSEKCYGRKLSKIRITGMAAANAMGNKLSMFVIGKAKNPGCFKMSSFYLVATEINKKVGWMEICLRSGSESWTGSLLLKEEILLSW